MLMSFAEFCLGLCAAGCTCTGGVEVSAGLWASVYFIRAVGGWDSGGSVDGRFRLLDEVADDVRGDPSLSRVTVLVDGPVCLWT